MPKRIIVVDTESGSLAELRDALEQGGYGPVYLTGTDDPAARFGEDTTELVFLNLQDAEAVDHCDQIRDNPDGAIVPIIFIGTGDEEISSPSDALTQGGDYYFGLPLDLAKVLTKVQTYVGPGSPTTSPTPTSPTPPRAPEAGAEPPRAELPAAAAAEKPGADSIPELPVFEAPALAPTEAATEPLANASDELLAAIEAEAAEVEPEGSRAPAEEDDRQVEAQRQAEEEARRRAEEESRRKAEEEARRRAEEEARRRAEEESRRKAEEEARRRAEEKARRQVEGETRRKVEEETRRKVEEENQRRAEEAVRQQAEEAARQQAEEAAEREAELRRQIEEETRRRVEEELRQRRVDDEAERKAAEEIERLEAERGAKRQAEEEEKRRAALLAEEEARQRADEEARRAVEEEKRRLAEQQKRPPVPTSAQPPEPQAWHEPAIDGQRNAKTGPATITPLEPAEGEFGGTDDVSKLLRSIWSQQVTGRVDFVADTRKKTVFFERGGPVDAYSSQVFDRMEEYLYREGKITRAQYQDVRVKGLTNPRRIGAHLVNEGHLKPRELFEVVRGHLREVYFGVFEWESGTFTYTPDRVEEDDRVVLDTDPRALIVEGIRRKYLMPRLMDLIGAPSTLLAPRSGSPVDVDLLGLKPEERHVLRFMDGTRSIEDLVFSTGLSAHSVYHVLAALVAMEHAEIRVRGIEGVDEDGTSAGDAIDRQRIREKAEHVRKLDYFQVLGVPQVATPYEIDRAYERVIHEFQANRFSDAVRRELTAELLEIEHVLEDARQILRDEGLRDAYARHLP